MKNADKPAMPSNVDAVYAAMTDQHDSWGKAALGLTKREMMAMHICSGNMAARTVPWADVNVDLMARIAVQMADALLAELER